MGSKDPFLGFWSYSFAIGEANVPGTLSGMSSGIYPFDDHLICGCMEKGLDDCCNSRSVLFTCNFWCKEHLANFVTDFIQALLFAAITLTFKFSLCQIQYSTQDFFSS